jgi:hypothetical protein
MEIIRIALANLPLPVSPEESVRAVLDAVLQAALEGAKIVCFLSALFRLPYTCETHISDRPRLFPTSLDFHCRCDCKEQDRGGTRY